MSSPCSIFGILNFLSGGDVLHILYSIFCAAEVSALVATLSLCTTHATNKSQEAEQGFRRSRAVLPARQRTGEGTVSPMLPDLGWNFFVWNPYFLSIVLKVLRGKKLPLQSYQREIEWFFLILLLSADTSANTRPLSSEPEEP